MTGCNVVLHFPAVLQFPVIVFRGLSFSGHANLAPPAILMMHCQRVNAYIKKLTLLQLY